MQDKKHKTDLLALSGWISMACAFVIIAYIGYYRFAHPDMTETRIFLNNWKLCLLVALFGMVFWTTTKGGEL